MTLSECCDAVKSLEGQKKMAFPPGTWLTILQTIIAAIMQVLAQPPAPPNPTPAGS